MTFTPDLSPGEIKVNVRGRVETSRREKTAFKCEIILCYGQELRDISVENEIYNINQVLCSKAAHDTNCKWVSVMIMTLTDHACPAWKCFISLSTLIQPLSFPPFSFTENLKTKKKMLFVPLLLLVTLFFICECPLCVPWGLRFVLYCDCHFMKFAMIFLIN